MSIRTRVASMAIAVARPRPKSRMIRLSSSTKLPKTTTMMAAAAVITRAVAARPSATELTGSPVRSYSSFMRDSRNTS